MTMRILTGKTMTCQTCDTAFEYEESEMVAVPGFSCMKAITCPNCH